MKNQIQQFHSNQFGKLEILLINGKPYFPATDCAKLLGYSNPRKAILDHCKGVTKRDSLTNGGVQTYNWIPEGDLYRLIIRSKLPSAEAFEKWVFDTVLPEIRNRGAYISDNLLNQLIENPETATNFFTTIRTEREEKHSLQSQAIQAAPKLHYHDTILKNPNAITVSVIAQDYDMTATAFNRLLHKLKIQYRRSKYSPWIIYYKYKKEGYTTSRTSKNATIQTCWTQKGRNWLYHTLKAQGIIPTSEKQAKDVPL